MNEYYRHFRNGKLYRFVTFATIEATGEEAVVYQAMYGDHRYWIRPRANFFEEVEYEGKMVPRFSPVGEEEELNADSQPRIYGFPPLLCDEPRILILGTLPGGESLEHRQYYYSGSNRIWKVLCFLTGEPIPVDYNQKQALLAKYHIVLWDYYESAIRPDSSNDKDIRDGHPNDLSAFLAAHSTIKTIGINGFGKYKSFGRKIAKELAVMPALTDVRVLRLPETSGSNKNHGWGYIENLAHEWAHIFD